MKKDVPISHRLILQKKRVMIHHQLDHNSRQKLTQQTKDRGEELQRELWVVNGVLEHGLDERLLNDLAVKFRKIGVVPLSHDLAAFTTVSMPDIKIPPKLAQLK